MADLLSLPDAKLALRIDGADYDYILDQWIKAVSARVWRYAKLDPADYMTSNGDLDMTEVPPELVTAAMFLLAYYYRWVDEAPSRELTHGEMPWQVQNILGELRDPTLA